MFYYYGRKKQIAKHYPAPKFGTIIEPFAGSAAYSLHGNNWENEVTLLDINEPIVGLWNYLKAATVSDIQGLPDVKEGDLLSSFNLCQEERLLMSLHVRPSAVSVRNKVGRFSRWSAGKRYICDNLHKIKHWTVAVGDYMTAHDTVATWFIDPPYREAGVHYTSNTVAYDDLAKWALSRRGLVISCEGEGHNSYLPFKPLCTVNNGGMNLAKKSTEFVCVFETEPSRS